jgi:hypothetical protein
MFKIDDSTWINPYQVVAVTFNARDGVLVHMSGGNRIDAKKFDPPRPDVIHTEFIEDKAELKKAIDENSAEEAKYRKAGQESAESLAAMLMGLIK